jgi:hypothetical protein
MYTKAVAWINRFNIDEVDMRNCITCTIPKILLQNYASKALAEIRNVKASGIPEVLDRHIFKKTKPLINERYSYESLAENVIIWKSNKLLRYHNKKKQKERVRDKNFMKERVIWSRQI